MCSSLLTSGIPIEIFCHFHRHRQVRLWSIAWDRMHRLAALPLRKCKILIYDVYSLFIQNCWGAGPSKLHETPERLHKDGCLRGGWNPVATQNELLS